MPYNSAPVDKLKFGGGRGRERTELVTRGKKLGRSYSAKLSKVKGRLLLLLYVVVVDDYVVVVAAAAAAAAVVVVGEPGGRSM